MSNFKFIKAGFPELFVDAVEWAIKWAELDMVIEYSTCKESLQVQTEEIEELAVKLKAYNLDVMIAVGYRVIIAK